MSIDRRFVAGVVVGLVLAGWFLVGVDWDALGDALAGVSVGWVALAAAIMLSEWFVRGLRWAVLVRPVDRDIPLGSLITATLIGAALNTILPLRGGDLLRPAILARRRGLSYALVFSTTVVERLFDVVGVLTVVAALLFALPDDLVAGNDLVGQILHWSRGIAVLGMLAALAVVVAGAGPTRRVVARLASLAPSIGDRVLGLYDRAAAGLVAVGEPWRVAVALLLTLVNWTDGLLVILCLFKAFGLDLPVAAGLFVQAAIAGSVALPQAPGYVGVFHFVIEQTLLAWGAPASSAQAAAVVFWAVSFVPVTACGLVAAWVEGVGLTNRESVVASARA